MCDSRTSVAQSVINAELTRTRNNQRDIRMPLGKCIYLTHVCNLVMYESAQVRRDVRVRRAFRPWLSNVGIIRTLVSVGHDQPITTHYPMQVTGFSRKESGVSKIRD